MKKPIFTITREIDVPIGHRLMKHFGKCAFCHGHNIKCKVEIGSLTLNSNDMVMDFHDLDKFLKEMLAKWDHGMLLNSNDPMIKDHQNVVKFYDSDPTAERMAEYIYLTLLSHLPAGVDPIRVTVFENDKSSATYQRVPDSMVKI